MGQLKIKTNTNNKKDKYHQLKTLQQQIDKSISLIFKFDQQSTNQKPSKFNQEISTTILKISQKIDSSIYKLLKSVKESSDPRTFKKYSIIINNNLRALESLIQNNLGSNLAYSG